MSRVSVLPEEVLKHVLHYVPLKERLGTCFLVSKGFKAAAVAATQELDFSYWAFRDNAIDRADSLLAWLEHYGQQLTHLKMHNFPRPLQQLPCPNLLELVLGDRCRVQLGPAADGTSGVIQGCTKLTKLDLQCDILDAPRGAVVDDSLSRMLQLEHLQVVPSSPYEYSVGGLHSNTLPSMEHLTHLEVRSLSVDNLLQLGGLTNLRFLHLRVHSDIAVGPNNVPGLVLPASLTGLVLWSPVEVGLLSVVPAGLKDFALRCFIEGAADTQSSLLSSMARLQHHTRLVLRQLGDLDWPPAGPAYSTLTASSNLVELSAYFRQELPMGIWQHVFPANRCLSSLTRLELDVLESEGAETVVSSAWDAADVASFVSCCPNIVEIESLFLQHGPDVASQLQRLTALAALEVHYVPSSVPLLHRSLKGLATVTQLQHVRVTADTYSPQEVSVATLLPLTSLTNLTSLSYSLWSVIPEDFSPDNPPELDDSFCQVRARD
jgi:hypothetical protein